MTDMIVACTVISYIRIAYIVMAYIDVASVGIPLHSSRMYGYDPYSHGIHIATGQRRP